MEGPLVARGGRECTEWTDRPLLSSLFNLPATTTTMNDCNLARVAELMDYQTREDNTAMALEMAAQERRIEHLEQREMDMASAIADLNRIIAQMEDDNRHLVYVVESHQIASTTMQRVIVAANTHLNMTIPDRRYEHRIATDEAGVAHVVIAERLFEEAEPEVIDLTADEDYDSDETVMDDTQFMEFVANL